MIRQLIEALHLINGMATFRFLQAQRLNYQFYSAFCSDFSEMTVLESNPSCTGSNEGSTHNVCQMYVLIADIISYTNKLHLIPPFLLLSTVFERIRSQRNDAIITAMPAITSFPTIIGAREEGETAAQ